jgi:hypothetical protein
VLPLHQIRCIKEELFSYATLLTQTNSIYRTTLSEMTSSNHVNLPLVQMSVLENTVVGTLLTILLIVSLAHPNHTLQQSRMRLRNYRQNLGETAFSPRT